MITDVYGVQGVLIQVMFLDGNKIPDLDISPDAQNEHDQGQAEVGPPAEVGGCQLSELSHNILSGLLMVVLQ